MKANKAKNGNFQVKVKREKIAIKTYPVGEPEKNPMFFEKRVYQGSCGKVYPVPFIDKVYDTPSMKKYDAVTLENEYVRLVLLPELGGRIYIAQDKKNGNYDFFYRNDVIKPALVGLAGPWVSGGVEFNWPQHHRPATFMPTDVEIEKGEDGSVTVWMSDHDPLTRMRGTHGICLKPGPRVSTTSTRVSSRRTSSTSPTTRCARCRPSPRRSRSTTVSITPHVRARTTSAGTRTSPCRPRT